MTAKTHSRIAWTRCSERSKLVLSKVWYTTITRTQDLVELGHRRTKSSNLVFDELGGMQGSASCDPIGWCISE